MVCKIVNCWKTSRKGAKIANLSTIGSLRPLRRCVTKWSGKRKLNGASQQKCNQGSVV